MTIVLSESAHSPLDAPAAPARETLTEWQHVEAWNNVRERAQKLCGSAGWELLRPLVAAYGKACFRHGIANAALAGSKS